ncbi:MAG TPA: FlgD immunoglobulin-like domain containing protein [Candidatus Krumholzibacteria bacterium]|nr:FlgD immunoglobulin-like domain containing protein [Candidatus Krumholzibacteria bacterium]HPD70214.1 FlgD immunoglobulin-like domain containing protein [Candidatus Krumholzibacteria bacterium]HRY40086.1 FlgD immunoglobulin-like domain containing protein [Candidatus Krumholzibacteria bacterium]
MPSTPALSLASAALVLALGIALVGPAASQCILANPSFELGGSGGAVFGGWNQFGAIGAVTTASHGARAARVSGPDNGGWAMSGYWQRLDAAPGDRWVVTGHVRHPAARPLVGQCAALVNVEWRGAGGELLDYDSFPVATAATAADTYVEFSVESAPAPAGTAAIHALFGVLQGPSDPSPDVFFDQVTVDHAGPPTIDDLQWSDFPGGTTLDFAGRVWRVKGPGYYGPGPNVFDDDPNCVWVDPQGRLHLSLAERGGTWVATEVVAETALGYGDYIVTTVGRLDELDPAAVLGIFLWQYGPCWDESYLWWNPYDEVDIEYSRWGDPGRDIGQFVAQPYDYPGNLERFDASFATGEQVSHAMRWLADRVEFRVWRGGAADESAATTIHAWTYQGPHVPRPEQPRLHLNLWKLAGGVPAADQEVVFADFRFVPAGGPVAVADDRLSGLPAAAGGRLLPAAPNPFNPQTAIRFELDRGGTVALDVHDLAGRRVRGLVSGQAPAGQHRTTWDGRDDGGLRVASGVYLVRLRGEGFTASQRVALIE